VNSSERLFASQEKFYLELVFITLLGYLRSFQKDKNEVTKAISVCASVYL
jgi:hypothetical protein